MEKWLFITGSPRLNGMSARVVRMLKMACDQLYPDIEQFDFEVARCAIEGCNGCEFCQTNDECIIEDEMTQLIDLLDSVDRVIMATPIYFAGLPSQMKAVLDRLQPYFWRYLERKKAGEALPEKRPLTLYVIGDGGDPHGYEGLVASVRSAFAVAGFRIDRIVDLVGVTRLSRDHLQIELLGKDAE